MASRSVNQEIETILAIIRENPDGVGIAELELVVSQRLDASLIRRTLPLFNWRVLLQSQ